MKPLLIKRGELIAMVTLAIVALVCLIAVAVAVSYSHMFDWALANGEPRWRARLSPITADGAILVASIVVYVDARMRHKPDKLAYLLLISGIAWSVFANVAHDWVSWVAAKLIAGWPPIAMAAAVEVLLRFVRRLRSRSDEQLRKAEKAMVTPAPASRPRPAEIVKPLTDGPILEIIDNPAAEIIKSTKEINNTGLTAEMREAGWAPSDYADLGKAMRGYLEKVNAEASGSDLWATVGPFFGKSGKDTGMGRTIARRFKEDQAAKSAAGE